MGLLVNRFNANVLNHPNRIEDSPSGEAGYLSRTCNHNRIADRRL